MTERRLHDMAPSSSAGPGDDMHWERNFIHQIKTLKSGSKDQLDSLTDLAINDASKRYKSIVNIVSKYSQTMKSKYRPSMMYVISSLVMHENEKIASLYRQRFAIEISVLVEKICECRTEQLERVRRNIERWREKECFESLVLDECEYHVQKFEEAGKEEEDGLLGMERIETPPPEEEEEEEKKVEEEGEKPTTTSTVNKWPKLMPTWGKNVKRQQKQQQQQQQQQKKQNKKRNREKFTNGSLRQQQQNMQPMNQQQKQQSQHGQGKPTKKQKRRMQKKKQGDKNDSNKEQRQQEKGGGGGEKGDQKKSVIDRLT